jgi:hypothetical protein
MVVYKAGENIKAVMKTNMKDFGNTIKDMVKGFIDGRIKRSMMDNGIKTKDKEKGLITG